MKWKSWKQELFPVNPPPLLALLFLLDFVLLNSYSLETDWGDARRF